MSSVVKLCIVLIMCFLWLVMGGVVRDDLLKVCM